MNTSVPIPEFSAFNLVASAITLSICVVVTVWLLGQRRGSRNMKRNMHIAFMETVSKRIANGEDVDLKDYSGSSGISNKSRRMKSRTASDAIMEESDLSSESESNEKPKVKIFFATQTGVARRFALQLKDHCRHNNVDAFIQDLQTYDPEESLDKESQLCVFIISTYVEGGPPESGSWFHRWLSEAAFDFRVGASHLQGLRYAVVGLGNSFYKENFNRVGKEIDSWLTKLSAKPVMHVGLMDENTTTSKHGGLEEDFNAWCAIFKSQVLQPLGDPSNNCCGGGDSGDCLCENQSLDKPSHSACQSNGNSDNLKSVENAEDVSDSTDDESEQDNEENGEEMGDGLVDLEDLGSFISNAKKKAKESSGPREMITPILRKSLEKQGYKLLGTHSGVKMCRWTKSMLRGRGGCYKHSFYGIASHQCMEATPSLACANKCVFCWRHHTNPVGTEWKWKTDPPEKIFQEALDAHRGLVRQFRGVPGVRDDRFQEGLNVQHCALSLVGEPIMYPHINQLVELLHGKGISTFLVTNAQFPDAIQQLNPVTQLYVSVDASTKDSLKKIDRPLFRDFWERLLDSLKALSEKGQRTVYRLTLVKAWNVDEIAGYVKLVSIGRPDFIEVKGVTFCGDSKASSLTMKNVPWHEEVLEFCRQLNAGLEEGDYEIACEHEHSNCVLIANTKFKVNGTWHTWINYKRFHELYRRWVDSEGAETFSSTDYMAISPSWSVLGASERGFDPVETRFRKERKKQAGTSAQ